MSLSSSPSIYTSWSPPPGLRFRICEGGIIQTEVGFFGGGEAGGTDCIGLVSLQQCPSMSVTPPNSSVPSACPNLPCYPKKEPPLRPPDSSSEEWVLQLGFCLGLATLPRGSCGWVGCPCHLPALPASPLPASQRAERLTPPSWTQVQLRNPVLWREKELPGAPGQEGPVGSRERQAL